MCGERSVICPDTSPGESGPVKMRATKGNDDDGDDVVAIVVGDAWRGISRRLSVALSVALEAQQPREHRKG